MLLHESQDPLALRSCLAFYDLTSVARATCRRWSHCIPLEKSRGATHVITPRFQGGEGHNPPLQPSKDNGDTPNLDPTPNPDKCAELRRSVVRGEL